MPNPDLRRELTMTKKGFSRQVFLTALEMSVVNRPAELSNRSRFAVRSAKEREAAGRGVGENVPRTSQTAR